MICVPIFESTTEAAIEAMKEAAEVADALELRLDGMPNADIEALMAARPKGKSLIATVRRVPEGGAYGYEDEKRVELLIRAAELGANFVDIELACGPEMIARLREHKGKAHLIVSWHNFMITPKRAVLRRVIKDAFAAGADVAKVVPFGREAADNGRILEVVASAVREKKPVIGFCMGEAGRFSRLGTLFMGGLLTFAYVRQNRATASGMFSVEETKRYLAEFGYLPGKPPSRKH